MDNVLIDRSTSGFDFRRWTDADDCWSLAVSALPLRTRGIYNSFPYASPLPPFQYAPYLHSSPSLPPLPPRHPLPPVATMAKYAASLPPPAAATKGKPAAQAGMAAELRRTGLGEYKRKKPRAPRSGEEPPREQRRRSLERAVPLPPAPVVDQALDDLDREVTRGFVEDLMHALAPPPSSLPLPTFSLVRTAAVKDAASCTV